MVKLKGHAKQTRLFTMDETLNRTSAQVSEVAVALDQLAEIVDEKLSGATVAADEVVDVDEASSQWCDELHAEESGTTQVPAVPDVTDVEQLPDEGSCMSLSSTALTFGMATDSQIVGGLDRNSTGTISE